MAGQTDPIENFVISRRPPRFTWQERMQGRLREVAGLEDALTPDELAGSFLVHDGGHAEPLGAPKGTKVGTAALRAFRNLGRKSGDAQRRAIVAYAGRFNRLGRPKWVWVSLTGPGGQVGGLVDAEPEILYRTESRALVDLEDAWEWAQQLRDGGRQYWRAQLRPICVEVPDDAKLDPDAIPLFAGIPPIPAIGGDPVYSDQGKTLIAVRAADWSNDQSFARAVQRGCAEWLEGRLFRGIKVEVAPPRGPNYTAVGGLTSLLLAAALELSGNKKSVRCKYCGGRFQPARPSRALFCSETHGHLWRYHHPTLRADGAG